MVPHWKRWLGTATVLLLVGAGCEAEVRQEASTDVGAEERGEKEDDGQAKDEVATSTSFDAEAEAAVDALLKESDDDAMNEYEEGKDADVIENDKAELDAYGKAYDKSEL